MTQHYEICHFKLIEFFFTLIIILNGFQSNTVPIVLDVNDVHVLKTPSYPVPYDNNAFIEWNVEVPPGFGVLLRFTNFGLKDQGDVLSVGKGSDSNDTKSVAGSFSSLSTPSDFVVWSNKGWIRFMSDPSGIGAGFVLEIRPIQGEGS